MCVIAFKPADKKIPDEYIDEAWRCNHDGGGIMWADEGKLWYQKGFFKLKEMKEAISEIEGKVAVLHFRIMTHGSKVVENCHPFSAGGGLMMAHNGIIHTVTPRGDESDTRAFARIVCKPIFDHHPERVFDPKIQKMLEDMTEGSKLVFLNEEGKHVIIHEKSGLWDEGVWWSNASYQLYEHPMQAKWRKERERYNHSTSNASYENWYGHDDWDDTPEDYVWDSQTNTWMPPQSLEELRRCRAKSARLMEKSKTTEGQDRNITGVQIFTEEEIEAAKKHYGIGATIHTTEPTERDLEVEDAARVETRKKFFTESVSGSNGRFESFFIGGGCERCNCAFEEVDDLINFDHQTGMMVCSECIKEIEAGEDPVKTFSRYDVSHHPEEDEVVWVGGKPDNEESSQDEGPSDDGPHYVGGRDDDDKEEEESLELVLVEE